MGKKQNDDIKRAVHEVLNNVVSRLKISSPSPKLHRAIKKYTRKLTDQIKAEIKQLAKKEVKKHKVVRRRKSSRRKPAI